MKRIGFIVDSMVPSLAGLFSGECGLRGYITGRMSDSTGAFMRYGWIAEEINKRSGGSTVYEMFRPWRKSYDAMVFLKSMGAQCYKMAEGFKRSGVKVVFDANVDYFSKPEGRFYYDGMAPSDAQIAAAAAMARIADGVIADSEYIASKCLPYNKNVECIPDNVNMDLVPSLAKNSVLDGNGRLKLYWCGESVKLVDLLAIEDVLSEFAGKIRLVIITNDMSSLARWNSGLKNRYDSLISRLNVDFVDYIDVPQLFREYIKGGIFISPRHMDNNYNHGHTEWKITLPMACGMRVICSPVPSYVKVAESAGNACVQVCRSDHEWKAAISSALSSTQEYESVQNEARRIVEKYYSSKVIAVKHLEFMSKIVGESL